MIKCYPFAKTVQASAMKACFQIAECCLSSTKIQNLAPPLQVFREENIREPFCSCSLKRKTSVSLHCQYSGNTLRSCYQMLIFLIESLDGETILTRTSVCHRQLSWREKNMGTYDWSSMDRRCTCPEVSVIPDFMELTIKNIACRR